MEVYYRIESRKYHHEEVMKRNGKKREKLRCEILADVKVDTFEEAIPVLHEQCANPEVDSVSIWYEEGSFGECCSFERDETWQPSYALKCYCYPKSQVDQYIEDRKLQLQERAEYAAKTFESMTHMLEYDAPLLEDYEPVSSSSKYTIKEESVFDEAEVKNHPLYNVYNCQIVASHDEWDEGYEDEEDWEWDVIEDSHEIAQECFEHFDSAMVFLKKQTENPEVNSIEIIAAHGCSNMHISFYRREHPYAEFEYSFEDIDAFIEEERVAHVKRMVEPDPFNMEMQYIDLLAGITPEQFALGKTVEEVKAHIPDCDQQIHNLLYMLSHRMMNQELAEEFDIYFDQGLPFFWDGIVDGAAHEAYMLKAWQEDGQDALTKIFQKKYVEDKTLSADELEFISYHTQIAYLYYYYGIYFHGLKYYVA